MSKTTYLPGQLPLFLPTSDWISPSELPDLHNVKEIALDTETRDFKLAAGKGPGHCTKSGYLTGVSLAWEDKSIYIPLRHPDTDCFGPTQVGMWLKDLFSREIKWVLHNAAYDFLWLRAEWGLKPPKNIVDTGALAALVDENQPSYSLDNLCRWQELPGKDERLLKEVAASYGFAKDVKSNLWRLPAKFVGPYAEQDATATLLLAKRLQIEIDKQELVEACKIENSLIPLIIEMSWRGVRLDINRAEQTRDNLIKRRNEALSNLSDELRHTVSMVDINSAQRLERYFVELGVSFQRTEKNKQAKLDSAWMEKNDHWLPKAITHIRQLDSAANKFIQGFLLDFAHDGRIYPNINQFRNEDGGTRSHRFSFSDPPLQQMPSRDSTDLKEELAVEIRGCFIPEDGELWGSHDLSQQEYRLLVHYAEVMKLTKANIAGDKYRKDPKTDFHNMVAEMTKLPRKRAKDVNFATLYGAQVKKFSLMTGLSISESKEIMEQYDRELPFAKEASEQSKRVADQRGYVRLLDGARCRFEQWEPRYRDKEKEKMYFGSDGCFPCSISEAQRRIEDLNHPWEGRLVRAYTYRALNRIIQGGAARQVKKSMVDCWNEGYIPLLQIHDELAFSHSNEQEGLKINEIMRDAVKLSVPMAADSDYGINWGTARQVVNKEKQVLYDASWESAKRLQQSGKWW